MVKRPTRLILQAWFEPVKRAWVTPRASPFVTTPWLTKIVLIHQRNGSLIRELTHLRHEELIENDLLSKIHQRLGLGSFIEDRKTFRKTRENSLPYRSGCFDLNCTCTCIQIFSSICTAVHVKTRALLKNVGKIWDCINVYMS